MEPCFTVLDAKPLLNDHKKETVAPIIAEILEEYGIDQKKIHAIVRGGAMGATTRLAGIDSIWCFAHVLNGQVVE